MRRLLLGLGLALLTACGAPGAADSPPPEEDDLTRACTTTSPRAHGLQLSVLPEAGEAPFVDVLHGATKSIRLMVYMLGKDGVFDALVERHAAKVDVKVILDGGAQKAFNQPAFDALTAAGIAVKWSDPKFHYMHAKSFVVDDAVAVISTGNFPKGLVLHERNYVAKNDNHLDVKSLASVFDADWSGVDPDVSCTRLLVSPINAKPRVIDLVTSAKTTLLVESLELADPDVIAAILEKKKAGLDVRVVLADPAWNKTNDNAATAKELALAGVDVRWIPKSRMLVHVKSVIVDGARAYLGSENMTTTSLTKNREIGLVVTDAPSLQTMATTFEADFASATPFASKS
jgi:phosphatidylserine/phosphatidylglycerophosphate/cardiolipin synthase-like enzyme